MPVVLAHFQPLLKMLMMRKSSYLILRTQRMSHSKKETAFGPLGFSQSQNTSEPRPPSHSAWRKLSRRTPSL